MAVHRLRRASVLFLVLAFLLLWTQAASALSYYPAGPSGTLGVSRPRITQQMLLGPSESIASAEMWLDGRQVFPSWNEAGLVYYEPKEPLAPGEHQVRLTIRVAPGQPGYVYAPVESSFSFTVGAGAVGSLPEPTAEELRALAEVNRYRQAAGVAPLVYDTRLAAAAAAQARYLVANPDQVNADGHRQAPGGKGFIAETVGGRARYYAYDGGSAEVINFVRRVEDAVAGWMDTIYHRVPLLQPGMSAMGYGLAGGREITVNVAQVGPNGEGAGVVRWPHAGQTGVPPLWEGLETPNPLDLYPSVKAPVGYPISLTFGRRTQSLRLTEWSLSGPEGSVALLPYDPVRDPNLTDDDTVAVIPQAPLRPGASYTVRLAGQVDLGDGPAPFAETWSFTTGAEAQPMLTRRVVNYSGESRQVLSIRLDGQGFPAGARLYLGGLPVEGLVRTSDRQLLFEPPLGYRGGPADLLLVTPGGIEVEWPDFFTGAEGYSFPDTQSLTQVPLLVRGQPLPAPALVHGIDGALSGVRLGGAGGGTVLLPESALAQLGATAERVPAIGRTYWTVAERLDGGPVLALGEGAATTASAGGATVAGQARSQTGTKPDSQPAPSGLAVPLNLATDPAAAKAIFPATTVGEYTLGRVTASVAEYAPGEAPGSPSGQASGGTLAGTAGHISGSMAGQLRTNLGSALRLRLPAQQRLGQGYVDAAFAQRLAGVDLQMVGDVLYVARRIGGQMDVDGHWAQAEVAQLLESGIVGGYGDGTFRPNTTLSRAAFVKMLVGAMGLKAQPGAAGGFADTAGHWVAQEGQIGAAVAAGIVRVGEYPRGLFEPERAIGREEIAVMLVRALGLEREALAEPLELVGGQATIGGRTFSDAGSWSDPAYVAAAIRAGLISGYEEPGGRYAFRPAQTATRAEAATMVVRAMGYRE